MLEVYDRQRRKVAVISNAFDITEEETINEVAQLSFSVPATDEKTKLIPLLGYARYNDGQLYRIYADELIEDVDGLTRLYTCEHVVATLADKLCSGALVYGGVGISTRDTIQYILSMQCDWILDDCDFNVQYEYGWENESILNMLLSIARQFTAPYIWTYDTLVYPWRISLKKIDTERRPQFFIQAGKNILASNLKGSALSLCTRLYGLGYGEGVNQLTIKSVNGGREYIDAETIGTYGVIERLYVDRSIEDPEILLRTMRALITEMCEPTYARSFEVADLYQLTNADYDRAEVGRVVLLTEDGTKTYITAKSKVHDKPGEMTLELSTRPSDMAEYVAQIADKQRIEQVYAQGASQIYAQSAQTNASQEKGATISFYIPEEMRIVNAVKAKITLSRFRSYSRTTSGGGGSTITSSGGGGGAATSESGGGTLATTSTEESQERTSASGGGSTSTSGLNTSILRSTGDMIQSGASSAYNTGYATAAGVSHRHPLNTHYHTLSGQSMQHSHTVAITGHSHRFTIPAHAHTVEINPHSHRFTIPSHTHPVQIPSHTHDIEQGIFEFGGARSAQIFVNGTLKGAIESSSSAEIDLTDMLVDDGGKIPRGRWIDIEVRPDALAYVKINAFVYGFIQSRGGGTH